MFGITAEVVCLIGQVIPVKSILFHLSLSHATFALALIAAALYIPTLYYWLLNLAATADTTSSNSQNGEFGYVFLIFLAILALGISAAGNSYLQWAERPSLRQKGCRQHFRQRQSSSPELEEFVALHES